MKCYKPINKSNNPQFNSLIQNQKTTWVIVASTIISALIAGAGVYYWQKNSFEKEKQELENKIEGLESQSNQVGQLEKTTEKDLKEAIVKKMIKNEEIRKYLLNMCHQNEIDCPDNAFYKWEESRIAFLSNLSEEKWKQDPFKYSTEIYKVDLNEGDVSRLSPFDGSYYHLLNISENNNEWDLYINKRLGFSIKTPKNTAFFGGSCEKMDSSLFSQIESEGISYCYVRREGIAPVKVFENPNDNIVYIANEYDFELAEKVELVKPNSSKTVSCAQQCNKIPNSFDSLHKKWTKDWLQSFQWQITLETVTNDEELEKFVKEQYGKGCSLGQRESSNQAGVYDIRIDQKKSTIETPPHSADYCVLGAITLKYYPEKNRVATWLVGGQAFAFRKPNKKDGYDLEMVNSFRFID